MKTFKEKFPSLSKKYPWTKEAIIGSNSFVGMGVSILDGDFYENAYGQHNIYATCLDRQKVLDAFEGLCRIYGISKEYQDAFIKDVGI